MSQSYEEMGIRIKWEGIEWEGIDIYIDWDLYDILFIIVWIEQCETHLIEGESNLGFGQFEADIHYMP